MALSLKKVLPQHEGLRFEVVLLFKVIEIGGLKEADGVSKHGA